MLDATPCDRSDPKGAAVAVHRDTLHSFDAPRRKVDGPSDASFLASRPGSLFARLAKAISQHRRYVSTCAQLHALTDRDLADNGHLAAECPRGGSGRGLRRLPATSEEPGRRL